MTVNWRADLATLFENTADGVWVSGPEGEILFWNGAAESILEHSASQVVGRPCRDIFCGRDGSGNRLCGWPCPIKTQLNEGDTVQHFDMLTRTKTGEPVWLDVSCLSLPPRKGRVSTVVHFFRDTTVTRQIGVLVRQQLAKTGFAASGEPPATLTDKLTERELQVIDLMQIGATTANIAERLSISRATVRNHIQNIFGKLKVRSRLEAVAYANRFTRQEPTNGA